MFALCNEDKPENLNKYVGWIVERKFDGCRAMVSKIGTKTTIFNRNMVDKTEQYPEIVETFDKIDGSFVIDGEIVVFDGNKENFSKSLERDMATKPFNISILAKKLPATFIAFDLIGFGGLSGKDVPLRRRKKVLRDKFVKYENDTFKIVMQMKHPTAFFETMKKKGYEGIVVKNPESTYQKGRTDDWIKVKCKSAIDLVFTKYTENPAGICIENKEGIRVQVSGKQSEVVKQKIDNDKEVLVEVNYLEKTENNRLRQPTFSKVVEKD